MSPFEKAQADKILSCYSNLELNKGYGSHGGHILGFTRSGKAIYESANHSGHKDFTTKEHNEAAKLHQVLKNDDAEHRMDFHNKQTAEHSDMAEEARSFV